MITAPLSRLILQQDTDLKNVQKEQNRLLSVVHLQKKSTMKAIAEQLEHEVPKAMKRSIDLAKEKGASTWLSVLSLIKHDLLLHKSAFHDKLCIRCGWLPPCLADTCPVVKKFTIDHALACPTGGYPTIRHNEVCDTNRHRAMLMMLLVLDIKED